MERAEREGGRHGESGVPGVRPPLLPFRQPAIPSEQETEMQGRACRQIRGEATRLAEEDMEVAARERRVREEEEAVARGAHRVLPDPEGDTPTTDVEGRSPFGDRAREEGGEAWQARGKRRRLEEQGAGEAEGAPRPASLSPEPTPTDWGSEWPPPRRYAPPPVRRGPATVAGLEGAGRGGACPLCEVGGEDEGGAGEARDPPLQRPGRQGGEAKGKGA